MQKSCSPKKLLQFICKILKTQLQKTKVVYTLNGIKNISLKGFKIEFSGCFEASRSQMSKTVKYASGSLSLTRLKNHVEYSNGLLFTKFGSCNFKI